MLYFNANGVDSIDFGPIVKALLGDMLIDMETLEEFRSGIGFKMSANIDLATIDFGAISDLFGNLDLSNLDLGSLDLAAIFGGSFDKLELAIEIVEVDQNNKFAQIRRADGTYVDKVLGGIYLNNGTLYLDATGLVDVAETYSRIDNFIDLVQVVIDKVATVVNKLQKDDAQSPEEATASADGEKVLRDAILALTYSDTTFQIQITKSLISLILATLLPDLGSIDEVFDQLEINLGVDIGREDYRRVSDLSTTILYNEYTVGTKKGYLPLSEYPIYRQDAQDNWVTAEYDPLQDNYVFYNGHYYEVPLILSSSKISAEKSSK